VLAKGSSGTQIEPESMPAVRKVRINPIPECITIEDDSSEDEGTMPMSFPAVSGHPVIYAGGTPINSFPVIYAGGKSNAAQPPNSFPVIYAGRTSDPAFRKPPEAEAQQLGSPPSAEVTQMGSPPSVPPPCDQQLEDLPIMRRCDTGADINFVNSWTQAWDQQEFSFTFDHELLPNVAALALNMTPRGSLSQAVTLHLYTDGTGGKSESEDSFPAFAVVIIAEVDNDTRFIVGTVADRLENAGAFVAANNQDTNNAAEVAGLAYAIAIALAAPPHIEVTITSDSMLALSLAESKSTGKKVKQSQDIVEPLWRALSANRKATLHHIPSHIGHPWNEMADGVAHSASLGTKREDLL